MRIAGIDPERNFGGGEVQVMGLTLELLRAGHAVTTLNRGLTSDDLPARLSACAAIGTAVRRVSRN